MFQCFHLYLYYIIFISEHYYYCYHHCTGITTLTVVFVIMFVEMKPGQLRCGEHSDYGSITLLFQDDAGGLEVLH